MAPLLFLSHYFPLIPGSSALSARCVLPDLTQAFAILLVARRACGTGTLLWTERPPEVLPPLLRQSCSEAGLVEDVVAHQPMVEIPVEEIGVDLHANADPRSLSPPRAFARAFINLH